MVDLQEKDENLQSHVCLKSLNQVGSLHDLETKQAPESCAGSKMKSRIGKSGDKSGRHQVEPLVTTNNQFDLELDSKETVNPQANFRSTSSSKSNFQLEINGVY